VQQTDSAMETFLLGQFEAVGYLMAPAGMSARRARR
jgi:hypothetical protein